MQSLFCLCLSLTHDSTFAAFLAQGIIDGPWTDSPCWAGSIPSRVLPIRIMRVYKNNNTSLQLPFNSTTFGATAVAEAVCPQGSSLLLYARSDDESQICQGANLAVGSTVLVAGGASPRPPNVLEQNSDDCKAKLGSSVDVGVWGLVK